ncbi:hypothetical protein VYF65_001560 [Lysinibacillus irui]|uniref:hypothetical protein n=1 Tax=Lysinibacillus irui TaxID=2998077 RepID=UPI00388A7626
MNKNNNGCQHCCNEKFNCTGVRPFRAIDVDCIQPNSQPTVEGTLAFGSFYDPSGNPVLISPATPPVPGQKIVFTTPGPSLNVSPAPFPNNTTDLQVAVGGIYEVNMNISVELLNLTSDLIETEVRFGLFINDTVVVNESNFLSLNDLNMVGGAESVVTLRMANTIGNTIQLRLNKDDRLSIRVILATTQAFYRYPSLVVTKIAD